MFTRRSAIAAFPAGLLLEAQLQRRAVAQPACPGLSDDLPDYLRSKDYSEFRKKLTARLLGPVGVWHLEEFFGKVRGDPKYENALPDGQKRADFGNHEKAAIETIKFLIDIFDPAFPSNYPASDAPEKFEKEMIDRILDPISNNIFAVLNDNVSRENKLRTSIHSADDETDFFLRYLRFKSEAGNLRDDDVDPTKIAEMASLTKEICDDLKKFGEDGQGNKKPVKVHQVLRMRESELRPYFGNGWMNIQSCYKNSVLNKSQNLLAAGFKIADKLSLPMERNGRKGDVLFTREAEFFAAVQAFCVFDFVAKIVDDPRIIINRSAWRFRARNRTVGLLGDAYDVFDEIFGDLADQCFSVAYSINDIGMPPDTSPEPPRSVYIGSFLDPKNVKDSPPQLFYTNFYAVLDDGSLKVRDTLPFILDAKLFSNVRIVPEGPLATPQALNKKARPSLPAKIPTVLGKQGEQSNFRNNQPNFDRVKFDGAFNGVGDKLKDDLNREIGNVVKLYKLVMVDATVWRQISGALADLLTQA